MRGRVLVEAAFSVVGFLWVVVGVLVAAMCWLSVRVLGAETASQASAVFFAVWGLIFLAGIALRNRLRKPKP